ncbi:sortase domain-containing protein [Streptomyces hundungensis]|uniref:sortase domain-containing protein n=1 Tax=Streptomyces hundungensis TaxID=1077946 RepID=UPI000EA9AA04
MPRAEPAEIVIPTIGLRTRVDKVTRATDGSVSLPADPDHAGCYTGSVTPGENGNAITVGHVDSHSGPAAFYDLGALRKGSRIIVTRHDGSTAHFNVTGLDVWAKDAFPSERVYGLTTTPVLTLITCTGWDSTHQTYRSNLVVTADSRRHRRSEAGLSPRPHERRLDTPSAALRLFSTPEPEKSGDCSCPQLVSVSCRWSGPWLREWQQGIPR